MTVRLGKIGYLNVLPIYHPLETGYLETDFSIVSGPPSALNTMMDAGELDISAASSIEYARHPEKYYLVPDIAIGSCGPVQSVLLLSQVPVKELAGQTLLVSSQTHTSAALLQVLLSDLWQIKTDFTTGDATSQLEQGHRPAGFLAIGDEALTLRNHPDYPYKVDMGEAWRDLTGLPFIFGVWIVQRTLFDARRAEMQQACKQLIHAKRWGTDNISDMCSLASRDSCMNEKEMCSYFDGLVYDFDEREQAGLELFYKHLTANGLLNAVPRLDFIPLDEVSSD